MSSETAKKYSSISKIYDIFEWPVEQILFKKLRKKAVALAKGKVLEVGAGTGKNFPYYDRKSVELTAIDFSEGMLEVAQKKKNNLRWDSLKLLQMDVEKMDFKDNSFDFVISTFVFCTVSDPQEGLKEIMRVLKPGGKAIFLEHMKSRYHVINIFLFIMNFFSTRLLGTSMLRETQKSIENMGFQVESVENYFFDVVRLVIARKNH
ncbi:methyltransferase domain-containing protein [Sulfurovum sp. zt1-1]|uniref:Methyltransferase domain-containing protein n=1 Tax=Sulfurovum zhangzhouensis TaxID=3019067 RepID=A0ABT7QWL2_9BACT|nr:class I SAM-dependent methyltransferase [Sulfurovum zhangzhouensis]MDM5271183.1 methyltransferase domain-containing protein [Sulfurovum zhangzhouensis]